LFHQLFKLFQLPRRQFGADLLVDVLYHLAHLGRDVGPNHVVAFLAVSDDFGDYSALFRRETKRLVEPADKILA